MKEKLQNILDKIKAISKKRPARVAVTHSLDRIKTRQMLVMSIIIAAVIGTIIFCLMPEEAITPEKLNSGFLPNISNSRSENIATSKDAINPDQIFKFKLEKDKEKLRKEIEEIKKTLSARMLEGQNSADTNEMLEIKKQLARLESTVSIIQAKPELAKNISISKINVKLASNEQKLLKTIDNTIPAGSFALGVLLSGLDASTSLSSSSDPMPVLIRLTDHGTLPRRFKSDLKDCHVIASGYGDLSSERVYMRLEKLTCIERETAEIIETVISGYVSGEDGKSGLRGIVVSKDAAYLANSAIGGIIGGFSNTMTPQRDQSAIVVSNKIPSSPPAFERFQTGFGNGMSTSMDRLSKYYIDRAEMLSPIIEVSAGRIVDIIFIEGTEIGSSNIQNELLKVRDDSRRKVAENIAKNEG